MTSWRRRRRRGRHDATRRGALQSLHLRRSVPIALVGMALGVTGCTSAPASSQGTSTSAVGTTGLTTIPASTTTTTTLPPQVALQGTSVPGEAFLGLVRRVPVVAVPAGQSTAPLPRPGSPGYLSIEQLAFRQFGSGPDLLLIMGQDGSMAWWQPSLLSALAQHYRVTVFDLPGVGYSEPSLAPFTLGWLADETAGLIQALALVQPAVLGWGLGGEVALALAERHPLSERSLVLVDTSAGGPGAARPTAGVSATLGSPAATASSVAATFFGPDSSSSSSSSSTPTGSSGLTGPQLAEAAWLTALSTTVPDVLTRAALSDERTLQLDLWSNWALYDGVDSVVVPTLVVYGVDDPVFPAPDGALLRSEIAGAERVELPDAGYAAMFEDASQFVSALEQFTG